MICHECEFYIKACMRMCDARCLDQNKTIDSLQLKTLVDSQYVAENIPKINLFLQRNASLMIRSLWDSDDEDLQSLCVAIYFHVLGPKIRGKIESMGNDTKVKKKYIAIKNGMPINVISEIKGVSSKL